MDERLPWFRNMSAENRSWLGLVAQAGIAAFLDWIRHPERNRPALTEVFGTAPRELARAVSLQQAVEMVRVIIDVVEAQVDELAAPGGEAELREAVLTYAREIAFSAAQVYARTAEARGAWDARLEALVVDSLVRGETEESLHSWASALNWSSSPSWSSWHDRDGTDRRRAEPRHRGDPRPGPAGPARPAGRRAGQPADRGPRRRATTRSPRRERFAGRFGPGPVDRRAAGPRPAGGVGLGAGRAGRAARRAGLAGGAPAGPARTTCCPSAPSTATPTPGPRWSATSTSRCCGGGHALLDTLDRLPGAGFLAGGHRPDAVRPHRIRSATGCAGSPSSPATPRRPAGTASRSGSRSSSAACGRRLGARPDDWRDQSL